LCNAIFMPALVAIRHNTSLKAKYDQLIAAGKEKKLAITAIMRKRLVLANSLLRDHPKWTEKGLNQDEYSSCYCLIQSGVNAH
jgi:hypothetical protein